MFLWDANCSEKNEVKQRVYYFLCKKYSPLWYRTNIEITVEHQTYRMSKVRMDKMFTWFSE